MASFKLRRSHIKKAALIIAAIGAILYPQLDLTKEVKGRVVGITDGDTLTLLAEGNRQVKVRLAEIDTPESKQPYGSRAKQELSSLAYDKRVRVKVQATDKYGRTVGRVYVDGDPATQVPTVDVNAEMVRRGAAWVYRGYSNDPSFLFLEEEAKREKRGLWSLPESQRTPPWEWRKENKLKPRANGI